MKFTNLTLLLAMLAAFAAPSMANNPTELDAFEAEDLEVEAFDLLNRALESDSPEEADSPEDDDDDDELDLPDVGMDVDPEYDAECSDDLEDCEAADEADKDATVASDDADEAEEKMGEANQEAAEAAVEGEQGSRRLASLKSAAKAQKKAEEAQKKAAEAQKKAEKALKEAKKAQEKAEKTEAKALENKKKFEERKLSARASKKEAEAEYKTQKAAEKKAKKDVKNLKKKLSKCKDDNERKALNKELAAAEKAEAKAKKLKEKASDKAKKQHEKEKEAAKKEKEASKAAKKAYDAAKKAKKAADKAAKTADKREQDAAKKVRQAAVKLQQAIEKARKAEEKAAAKAASKAEKAAAKAARKAARDAKRAAKKAAKKAAKAAKALRKKERRNKRKNKKAKKDLDIIGGKCVADHTCATIRGDPHLVTFDGLKYDCQGNGEFVLVKSMETGFEIQGRFAKTGRKDKAVTITKAVSIDSGVEGVPQVDLFAEEVEGVCVINYYVDGKLAEWGEDGKAYNGIEFMEDVDAGKEIVDFVYFSGSGVMYTVLVKAGSFGCVLNSKICLPPEMVKEETIIGLLGTPNNNKADDWMSAYGSDLAHGGNTKWGPAYDYCTREWCVHSEDDSIFGYLEGTSWEDYYGCSESYDPSAENTVASASDACKECCSSLPGVDENEACLLECMEGDTEDCKIEIENEEVLADVESKCPDTNTTERKFDPNPAPPKPAPEEPEPSPTPKKGSSSGDPHFKTWHGEKYDYHGECDLVLLDHPKFYNGLGLRVHIRTTRVKYFSFIEIVTVQIGDDVLEFDNSVENFLINGATVEENKAHHKTYLGGFVVRRDKKALSIRLQDDEAVKKGDMFYPKIDLHTRKNGFPAVIVDAGHTDIFKGSLGLLGDWETGKRFGRDGVTELNGEDATPFALEWQVRDNDPKLFSEERFPQFPSVCTPPEKMPARLGSEMARKEAEEACAHWEDDQDDCIFDVMATRDVLVAEEGHIVHVA